MRQHAQSRTHCHERSGSNPSALDCKALMPAYANEHFQQLSALSQRLAGAGLVVYEHHYQYLGFGSFMIEIGRAHRRLQFKWDGKERWLVSSSATPSSQGDPPAWAELRAEEVSNTDDPFATIEATANEHFGI